jgi:outer membrane protein assembly factor BamD (BamD/ComL family)
VIRAIGTSLVALSLGAFGAPLQCGSGHDRPHEDSAGDALYNLAQDFRAKGNEQAAKETLRYLVEHYPSNRHAPEARAELGETGDKAPAPSKNEPNQ